MDSSSAPVDRASLITRVRTECLHSVYAQPGWLSAEVAVAMRDLSAGGERPVRLDSGPAALLPRLEKLLAAHDAPSIPRRLALGEPIRLKYGDTLAIGPGNQLIYRSPPFHDPTRLISRIRLVLGGIIHRMPAVGLKPIFQGADPDLVPADLPQDLKGGPAVRAIRQLKPSGIGDPATLRGHQGLTVTLHPGIGESAHARFVAAERIAPHFAALFAHSPLRKGQPSAFVSRRLAEWIALDPKRTGLIGFKQDEDPAETMLLRLLETPFLPEDLEATHGPPPAFGDWLARPDQLPRAPVMADWNAHTQAMLSPILPRGGLDLAITDSLDMRWLPVPILMWWALLWAGDPRRWQELPLVDLGQVAARGTRVPGVVVAGHQLFDHALKTLEESHEPDLPRELLQTMRAFRARFLDQGRMPADDLIDRSQRQQESEA